MTDAMWLAQQRNVRKEMPRKRKRKATFTTPLLSARTVEGLARMRDMYLMVEGHTTPDVEAAIRWINGIKRRSSSGVGYFPANSHTNSHTSSSKENGSTAESVEES